MKVTVLGFTLSPADKAQIIRIFSAMEITAPISIIDTRSTTVDLANTDIVITVGKRASSSIQPLITSHKLPHIILPDIKKLYPLDEGGNIEARQEAMTLLQQLKISLQTGKFVSEEDNNLLKSIQTDDIPDFSIGKIQQLEQALQQNQKLYWRCSTKSGKILCISSQQLERTEVEKISADVYITFSELIALRAAMDIFKINEVTFAKIDEVHSD